MGGSDRYRVRVRIRGELSPAWWSGVFAGLAVEPEPDGTTVVSGELADQAALHGLLAAIRDRGLTLVFVAGEAADREAVPDRPFKTGGD